MGSGRSEPASDLRRWSLVLATGTVLAAGGVSSPPLGDQAVGAFCWPDADRLADGDLVLMRGTDVLAATVIAADSQARFSHVGMIVLRDGQPFVIHATPPSAHRAGGVQLETLAAVASPQVAADVAIYRIASLDAPARRRIRDFLFSQRGRPFDFQFRYTDDAGFYCTELVLKALDHAGLPVASLLPRREVLAMAEPAFAPDAVRSIPHLQPVFTPVPPPPMASIQHRRGVAGARQTCSQALGRTGSSSRRLPSSAGVAPGPTDRGAAASPGALTAAVIAAPRDGRWRRVPRLDLQR